MDRARVARAIRRAFHAGRSPPITLAHRRGRRCRSSRASPRYARPVSVGIPTAAANSAMQNSATNGAPSPAMASSVSPNRSSHAIAASSRESTECIAAHATAACRTSASARSAAVRRARAKSRTSAAVSSSAVASMGPTQAAGTDTQGLENRGCSQPWRSRSGNENSPLGTATTRVDPDGAAGRTQAVRGQRNHRPRRPRDPEIKYRNPAASSVVSTRSTTDQRPCPRSLGFEARR